MLKSRIDVVTKQLCLSHPTSVKAQKTVFVFHGNILFLAHLWPETC